MCRVFTSAGPTAVVVSMALDIPERARWNSPSVRCNASLSEFFLKPRNSLYSFHVQPDRPSGRRLSADLPLSGSPALTDQFANGSSRARRGRLSDVDARSGPGVVQPADGSHTSGQHERCGRSGPDFRQRPRLAIVA